jgi:hypothetical protein
LSLEWERRPRYGCKVEERSSWLPAGLESSGPQPDDRASQRGDARAGKRSGGAPSASGNWQPYDPDRPESKRSRPTDAKQPKRSEAPGNAKGEPEQTAKPEPKGRPEPSEKPAAKAGEGEGEGDRGNVDPEGRSDVDAMGQDKHRTVIGQRYGASRAKQVAYYGAFVAFVIVAYLGLKTAADHLDKAPAHDRDQAPWSKPGAPDAPLGGFTPKTPGEKGPANFQ